MATINATNGIIKVKATRVSNSGDSVLLAIPGTGSVNSFGMKSADISGYHKWEPSMVPAVGTELEIPCAKVTTRTSTYVDNAGVNQSNTWLVFE